MKAQFIRGIIQLALCLGVCEATVRAQMLERDAVTVPVIFQGKYYQSDGEESCDVLLTLNTWDSLGGTGGDPGWYETNEQTIQMKPGVDYYFASETTGVDVFLVQVDAPSGYRVYIDDMKRTRSEVGQTVKVRVVAETVMAMGAAAALRPGRVVWEVGMGRLLNGETAGAISLRELDLSYQTYRPYALVYDNASPQVERILVNGVLRQVYAINGLADITEDNDHAFRIKFYPRTSGQIGSKVNGVYTITGSAAPLFEYVVENPTYPSTTKLRITRIVTQGATSLTTWTEMERTGTYPNYTYTVVDWVEKPTGATSVTGPVVRTYYGNTTITGNPYASVLVENRSYTTYSWGTELASISTGISPQIESQTFNYTDKRVTNEVSGGTSSTYSSYYSDFDRKAQIYRVFKPFVDAVASSADLTLAENTTFDYEADWTGRKTLPKSSETRATNVVTSHSEVSYVNEDVTDSSRSYQPTANATMKVVAATRKDYYDATHYLTTVTRTYRDDSDPETRFFPGLPHSVKRPDGTMTLNFYYRGTFNTSTRTFTVSTSGAEVLQLKINGTSDSSGAVALSGFMLDGQNSSSLPQTIPSGSAMYLVPGISTAQAVVNAADGVTIATISYLYGVTASTPVWRIYQRDVHHYDAAFYLERTSRDSGDARTTWDVVTNSWTKGRLDYTIDEAGIRTDFAYDSSGRVGTKTRQGATAGSATIAAVTTTFAYDAAGHVITETVSTAGQSETLVTSRTYDQAGRVTSETKPGYATAGTSTASAVMTSYSYDLAGENRVVTTTLPSGSTRVEAYARDKRLKSITGTGVIPEYHNYSVETDGRFKTTINSATSTNSRKRDAWTDMLGRVASFSRPGFTGQAAEEETSIYDDYTGGSTGRRWKTTKTGVATTRFEFNSMSQVTRSGLDIDATPGLQTNSATDRITDGSESFEDYDGAWWLTTTTSNYPFASSGTATEISRTRKRLTGLTGTLRSETRTYDADGNETRVTIAVDATNKLVTTTTTRTGLTTNQVEKALNGLPIETTGHDGLTYKKRYDALGRLAGEIDPRTGSETNHSTKYTYHANTTWVKEVNDAPNNRLSLTHYDTAGRVIYTANAADKTKRTSYTARSEVEAVWGTATYPVSYVYNGYGERTAMRTYRDAAGVSLTDSTSFPSLGTYDETTWEFDTPSGLLKKKTDALGKFVEYTYNSRRQVHERFWSRTVLIGGVATRVTSTHSYDSATGEETGITYNDGTPELAFTYTRLGQLETVQDATSASAADLRDLSYDSSYPLRLVGETMTAFYNDRALSRLYETSGVLGRPRGFKLGAAVGSNSELEQTYGYSATTGRFDSLTSSRSSNATSRVFHYGYETDSPLVKTLWTDDNSFFVTRSFEANRDVLTSIDTKWGQSAGTSISQYAYVTNNLGQRQSVEQSGDAFTSYYSSATIHQTFSYNDRSEVQTAPTKLGTVASPGSSITNRQHEFDYDAIGNRKYAGVTGNSGDRKNYTSNAVNQYSARDNSVSPFTGTQSFTYDDDGNILTDGGQWIFTWDAENRLVRMSSALPSGQGYTRLELTFKYDYLGRRVEKKVINLDGPTPNTTTRFLYDGWSLVAEYSVTSLSPLTLTLTRSYTWGLDITSDLTSAGGVGALVQLVDHGTGAAYHPSYDGNGNIMSLVSASTGTIAAAYEYSPYGELIRAAGSYATTNSFRFSTKFTDDETGLVYYGRRYYSPSQGRFFGRDPIDEEGGLNLYGFSGNDAINGWDLLGMTTPHPTLTVEDLPNRRLGVGNTSYYGNATWTGTGVYSSVGYNANGVGSPSSSVSMGGPPSQATKISPNNVNQQVRLSPGEVVSGVFTQDGRVDGVEITRSDGSRYIVTAATTSSLGRQFGEAAWNTVPGVMAYNRMLRNWASGNRGWAAVNGVEWIGEQAMTVITGGSAFLGKSAPSIALSTVARAEVVESSALLPSAADAPIWTSIQATQPVWEGTVVPRSFVLATENGSVWVHGNGTEHLAEYATAMLGRGVGTELVNVATQAQLTSLQGAVQSAMSNGITYNTIITIAGWELRFGAPRQAGMLPALIHAFPVK